MELKLWHNGTLKEQGTPLFPFHDRIRLGDGVFDTMLIQYGEPHLPQEHQTRLLHDASIMGLTGIDRAEIEQAQNEVIRANIDLLNKGHYALNTLITRGSAQRGLKTPNHNDFQIVLRLTEIPTAFPPINAIIAKTTRRNEGSPLSRIKSINYGDNILAMREAESLNANEAIMINNAGHVACVSSGTLYAYINNKFYTPPIYDGAMDGVIRKILIKEHGIIEKTLSQTDIKTAEYLYISNSIRGIVPISTLDGTTIKTKPLDTINKALFS